MPPNDRPIVPAAHYTPSLQPFEEQESPMPPASPSLRAVGNRLTWKSVSQIKPIRGPTTRGSSTIGIGRRGGGVEKQEEQATAFALLSNELFKRTSNHDRVSCEDGFPFLGGQKFSRVRGTLRSQHVHPVQCLYFYQLELHQIPQPSWDINLLRPPLQRLP